MRLRPNNFGETVGDVSAQAKVNTLHHSLAQVQAKTPGDTLRDVKAEALADTQAHQLAEVKARKVGETLTDLKNASPVLMLVHTR